jgi:hypothetical protein
MILSAHQPAYFPWLGYFDKISKSDLFVYLDSVQFEKGSFTNRNKIKSHNGPVMLTVPVKLGNYKNATIAEIAIDNSVDWRSKHLKTIRHSYAKCTRFEKCYEKLEVLFNVNHDLLSELCIDHLNFWLCELGLRKKIIRSSTLGITSKKSDLILDLCKYFKADHYLSGAMGRGYLVERDFAENQITIDFQEFKHPVYPQIHGDFLPNMGIVDMWMNRDNFSISRED